MFPFQRKTGRRKTSYPGKLRHPRFSRLPPWIFVGVVVAVTMLPLRQWLRGPASISQPSADSQVARDAEMIWRQASHPGVRHPVDVLRTIDGDTFEARVHLSPGVEPTTRVRLRGVDAPELKAACAEELELAEAAGDALRRLLGEGGVTISNIGPDKYNGRVVADVATRRTDNVATALLAAGHARGYVRGRRGGWC